MVNVVAARIGIPFISSAFSILAGCAGSTGPDKAPDDLNCPGTQMIVCTGETGSKIKQKHFGDPRFCNCKWKIL